MKRIAPAQERDRRWAVVNAVMNLQVPYNVWYFLSEELSASREQFCSTKLVS